MISNSSSEIDNSSMIKDINSISESGKTSNIESRKMLSNSNLCYSEDKNIPSNNTSQLPMNNSVNNNIPSIKEENSSADKKEEEEEGVFSRIFSYIKNNLNPWKIEEEEVIDAHGFKCKRPKTKIPLRKKKDTYEDEIQKAGGESMSYASQHSGFGHIFL